MKRFSLIIGVLLLGLVVRAQSVSYPCRYWFDQDEEQIEVVTASNNLLQMELDVETLSPGIHLLYMQVKDTTENWCSPEHYIFYKVATENPINTEDIVYHCWFDQDVEHMQSGPFGTGQFLLNAAELEEGTHLLYVTLENNGLLTSAENYLFYKVAVENPINPNEIVYRCWFDHDYSTLQTGVVGNGLFQLDTEALSGGIHTLYIQLDNGTSTAPQCYLFYKKPEKVHIARWEYWLNDAINQRHTTNLSPYVDTLSIISLLPVETWPIRSSCFHFHPNGDEPYISAKNKITFRFWDTECHCIDKSALYIDEHVQEPVLADSLIRDTTVCITAPRDNQIHWFKVPLQVGDSIAFMTDKACTMQLFAPSGEEVFNAAGPESVIFGGIHAWEDGNYYLAVHDVTGSGEEISLTNIYVHRYAVLAYDVHLVGNGGCSTITFQGNGFNSLQDAYLVNYQNDTIHRLDIGHESNTTTTVTFDFYQANLGVYDAVFQFYGETIRVNGALEAQEPVDILLTSSVSYPSQFLRNTPCTYTYTITNNGNMSAYGVPIFVYIFTATMDGISHLEFDGMDLPSVIAGVNLDTLSENEYLLYKQWANQIGEDHHFIKLYTIDEETGDSIVVRSNYFCINLAPFEEKTIKLTITANELLNVWVTIPVDVIPPLFGIQNRSGGFCCVTDKIACFLDIVCGATDLASLISNLSGIPVSTALGAANCICQVLQTGNTIASKVYCREDGPGDFMSNLRSLLDINSIIGTITTCVQSLFPGGRAAEAVDLTNKITSYINVFAHPDTVYECLVSFLRKKPNCPDGGDSNGGSSEPVNSLDPNDIYGYLSESGSHFMRQEIQNVQYEIEFENDTTLATAAAHTIIVRDTLDATKFDLNSLAARSVTIGDKRLDLNGEQTFARTLDLRPEIYVIAQIEQDYNPATGIVEWTIQSLDPMTMEPTDDPNQGVLPVNYNGDGVGFIDYSIDLKEAFADGTEISNRAGIIFDQEDIIMTPTWTNTVDAVKPTSHIEEVTPVADSLSFSFVSEDNRSGVWYHSLYYRNDSTDMQWQVKKPQITENSLMLYFDDFQTTEYLVMATDSAGNVEEKEMVAEYTYYYEGPGPASQTNLLTQGWNWWSTYVEMNNVDGLGMLQNSLGHNGQTIKSQNDFTDNYYQDMGEDYWYGSLESIQNEQGYLINVADACSVTMTGSAAIPALHPITIQPNWNWIGYPVAVPQTVANALSGFNPMPDDVVKGQSDFTSYYEGFGWYPDDFMLVPGQSYLYFSNANAGKTLTYASGSRGGALKSRKLGSTYWNNNVHAFADNLSVMAVVKVDSIEQRDEHLELGAFVNGECRGSVRLRYFAPLDRYYAMLTVSGQDGDLVGFRLIHSESLEENETCGNHLVFSKNAIVGSLGKPYEVRFGEAEDAMMDMVLYPNPVERGATFSLMIPSGETVTEVIITDVVGNQLRHETGAINAKSIKGLPTAGVYVIKAVAKSGNTYHGRLIVE